MSHHTHSVYEDDIFSTTSSQWTTIYRRLPEKTPFAMKFMQWAAGAPVGAKAMKKKVRDFPDDRSTRSGSSASSYSYWMDDSNVQMYWVVPSDARSYSSGSSSASRSSKGSRKSRKPRRGGPPVQPMGFPPAPGHFQPPPPPPGHFGGGGDFYEGAPPPMAPPPMHHPSPMNVPPPPPPPMAGGGGDAPAFFDLTGQGGAGVSFNNHHAPEVYSDDESDYSSGYSDGYEH